MSTQTIAKPQDYDYWRAYQPHFWGGPMLGFKAPHPRALETVERSFTPNPDDDPLQVDADQRKGGGDMNLWTFRRIAARRNVDIQFHQVLKIDCVPCSPRWQQAISASVMRVTNETKPRLLPSGAGHDAMMMATLTDIGMLFVRCGNGGISHHPDESLSEGDADIAARVFADLLLRFNSTSAVTQ
jgi:hypothetical protein